MKKWMQLALGVLTGVGGFFDIGNLATSAQAGASFRFQLLWSLLLATVLVIFLVEMSGRYAAVSGKALPDAIRERFGFKFWAGPFLILSFIHVLVLGAEIGGICFALHLVTGLPVPLLAPVVVHHPPLREVAAGMVPSLPHHHPAQYWYIAVSIVGAVLAPYLFYFYSSGAVEDRWDKGYVGVNRGISVIGMGFGSLIAVAAVIVAAVVLAPRGIRVDDYHQAALMLTDAFPFWGFVLFAVAMGVACL